MDLPAQSRSTNATTPSGQPPEMPAWDQPLSASQRPKAARLHRILDGITEGLIYFAVIFNPWVFGTTQPWAVWVMNVSGYVLGLVWLTKIAVRRRSGYYPARWDDGRERDRSAGRWLTGALAVLTVLILGYCLISALNARATYLAAGVGQVYYKFFECIPWLPHSYDAHSTWFIFWEYLGLALSFWATRDWLLCKTRHERSGLSEEADIAFAREHRLLGELPLATAKPYCAPLPARLKRLLWLLCLNGLVLGVEGIVQRLDGTSKLLWLVQPRFNYTADAQFGPYAYRSNGAQYFNLVWPVCLGFWWTLKYSVRQSLRSVTRAGGGAHSLLLPAAVLMAACPIVSTSRGGAIVAALGWLVAFIVLMLSSQRRHWLTRLGLLALFLSIIGLGGALGWEQLRDRLKTIFTDQMSQRIEIYENSRPMISENPVFGTGPGSFASLYYLYRAKTDQRWHAYLHDDFMETRATWGGIGYAMILLALVVVVAKWWFSSGAIASSKVFMAMLGVSLGGCLMHARGDFPLQIHSILSLFLLLSCVVFCSSRKA